MAVTKICCTCLSFDVEMFSLTNDEIRECLENMITNMKVEDELLQNVCSECVSVMKKFVKFKERCLEANQRLRRILSHSTYISEALLKEESRKLYSETTFSFDDNPLAPDTKLTLVQIKQEILTDECTSNLDFGNTASSSESHTDLKIISVEDNVKLEYSPKKVGTDCESDTQDNVSSGNSGLNDVGAKIIEKIPKEKEQAKNDPRSSKKKKCTEKNKTLLVKKKEDLWKSDFAVQVCLKKEQQMEEFLKRDISESYLKAPFKCAHCFTGFTSEEKFEKHMELHNESRGAWECEICKLRYSNLVRLRIHQGTHRNRYKCLTCGDLAKSRSDAKRHNNQHLGINVSYECKVCHENLPNKPLYTRHIRTAHPTDYACDLCGDYFHSQFFLENHKRIKTDCSKAPKSLIQCKMCDKEFLKLGNSWYGHMLRHSRDEGQSPPTECQICGHATASWPKWSYHFCSEHRNKSVATSKAVAKKPAMKFICDICGNALGDKGKLVQHMRSQHTAGTSYNKFNWQDTCEICAKPILRANMKKHLLTHTGEKPYKCDACGKCFTQAFSRDEHARTVHKMTDAFPVVKRRKKTSPEQSSDKRSGSTDVKGKPLKFPCLLCPKKFKGRQLLIMHERSHSGEKPYACEICHSSYVSKYTLEVHRRLHTGEKPYPCDLCDQRFTYKSSLVNHVKDHTGEITYACNVCNRGFKAKNNLKRHELVHTGVKNHACDLCGKTFMHSESLKLHVKTIHLHLPHPPRKPRKRKPNE